jgi:hypothetical protein
VSETEAKVRALLGRFERLGFSYFRPEIVATNAGTLLAETELLFERLAAAGELIERLELRCHHCDQDAGAYSDDGDGHEIISGSWRRCRQCNWGFVTKEDDYTAYYDIGELERAPLATVALSRPSGLALGTFA